MTVRLFEHALTTQFNIHAKLTPNASVILILLGLTLMSALVASIWPAIGAATLLLNPHYARVVRRAASPERNIELAPCSSCRKLRCR